MQEAPETPERQGTGAVYNGRGLHMYQKDDQIKTLTGNRWDVASRGAGGAWYRASFAGGSTARERPYRTTEKGRRHAAAVGHALLVQPVHGGGITVGEREPAWMAGCSDPRLGRMP